MIAKHKDGEGVQYRLTKISGVTSFRPYFLHATFANQIHFSEKLHMVQENISHQPVLPVRSIFTSHFDLHR